MTRRRTAAGVALVAALALVTACGSDKGSSSDSTEESDTTQDATDETIDDTEETTDETDATTVDSVDGSDVPTSGLVDFGIGKTAQPYDEFIDAAFADITAYWADEFPTVYGAAFEPVSGIYAHYPGREDLPPSCAGPVAFSDVEGNAFFTSCGDIIVYDDAVLLPDLVSRLGVAAVGVVAAHEYGHAVQQRAGIFDLGLPTVDTEQQADCFAGAWTAHLARGENEQLPFGDEDVKSGLVAMIEIRDDPGSDVLDPSGHGTAFDRVGAFQEGFIKGPERCAGFLEEPNPRVDLVFTGEDLETGGNLPFDDMVELLPPSLDTFWLPVLEQNEVEFTSPTLEGYPTDGPYPECDGRSPEEMKNHAVFCADTNTIAIDQDFAVGLYDTFGDLSFGYPIAGAYSEAVQTALGTALEGEPRVLLDDCLVGAWLVDIVPVAGTDPPEATNPDQPILLSAGDLDEVVLTAVILGDEATSTDVNGTAFEKIDSFRAGVLGGLAACVDRAG